MPSDLVVEPSRRRDAPFDGSVPAARLPDEFTELDDGAVVSDTTAARTWDEDSAVVGGDGQSLGEPVARHPPVPPAGRMTDGARQAPDVSARNTASRR